MFADFIHQMPYPADRPEARQEIGLPRLFGKLQFILEHLLLQFDGVVVRIGRTNLSTQNDCGRSVAPIVSQQGDLRTREQVGQLLRIQVRHIHPFEIEHHIGQNWIGDLVKKVRNLDLDVFLGRNVVGHPAVVVRDRIEQSRVDAIPHTKREDPHLGLIPFGHIVHNPFDPGLPHRRQTIGQEDNHTGPSLPIVASGIQGRHQGVPNSRPSRSAHVLHKLHRPLDILLCRLQRLLREVLDFRTEPDEPEAVALAQGIEAIFQGIPCLVDLLARHRTGRVKDKGDILGHRLAFGSPHLGRQKQHERTGAVGIAIGNQVGAQFALVRPDIEFEIPLGRLVLLIEGKLDLRVASAIQHNVMRGRIDRSDRQLRRHHPLQFELADGTLRLIASNKGVGIHKQIEIAPHHLTVLERHPAFLKRFDGENSQPDQIASDIFEQGGVAHAADNAFVDLPGLLCLDHLALDRFAVNVQTHVLDRRIGRKGKQIGALEPPIRGVAEDLIQLRHGHLIADFHLNLQANQFCRGDIPTGRLIRRTRDRLYRHLSSRWFPLDTNPRIVEVQSTLRQRTSPHAERQGPENQNEPHNPIFSNRILFHKTLSLTGKMLFETFFEVYSANQTSHTSNRHRKNRIVPCSLQFFGESGPIFNKNQRFIDKNRATVLEIGVLEVERSLDSCYYIIEMTRQRGI